MTCARAPPHHHTRRAARTVTAARVIANDPDLRDGPPVDDARANGSVRPPHDLDAERALLGDLLVFTDHIAPAAALAPPGAFHSPMHARICAALIDLSRDDNGPVDPPSVALAADVPNSTLVTLMSVGTGAWRRHATRVATLAHLRNAWADGAELRSAAQAEDLAAVDAIRARVAAEPTTVGRALAHQTLAALLADDSEPEYDWVIEGLLERTDRVLLTGPEGGGKSTLIRQMSVQAAAGIHPFTLAPIDPLRVLLIDLENSHRHVRRKVRSLDLACHKAAGDNLIITTHPAGLDLTDPTDAAAFDQLISATQPDLVAGGPVYKLVGGDPTEEGPAKVAAMLLDRLRVRHGFALVLETHQPHGEGGRRPERPYGASLWKRWPEFGLHLADNGAVRHWRGDRDERAWPAALQRGGEWPWTITDTATATFARMVEFARSVPQLPSNRQIAKTVGCSEATVRRAIEANQQEWNEIVKEAVEDAF